MSTGTVLLDRKTANVVPGRPSCLGGGGSGGGSAAFDALAAVWCVCNGTHQGTDVTVTRVCLRLYADRVGNTCARPRSI
jgi:hypothetical protein